MTDADFPALDETSDMSQLSEETLSPRQYRPGELVEGEVVRVDEEGIVVSVGLKTEGMVLAQDMHSLSQEERDNIQPGDTLQVALMRGRGPGDMALLSLDRAIEERNWLELHQCMEEGVLLTARITGQNRGGVEVDFRGIRGFVPFSQLAPLPRETRDEVLAARMGQEAQFNVLELDQGKERLVLSERALWQQQKDEARQRFIANLEEGSLITGRVTSLRGFGAFVNLGDADGLIPISELSWTMLKSPEEAVSLGDEVRVQVLRVDQEKGQIALSLKRTLPEPWETVPERYSEGQIVEGTVTRLAEFGAFVKLEDWVEGLVHISELSPRRVNHPKECVYMGQKVSVMVLSIDAEKRRISLSYKKAYGL
jgi:small subunit ribosomal protein S1